ncbi:ABC transporter permease subunit [Notoacmeibacter sp. MSK16QG-6]|uniref:ABC transporter permease subunit n=1 Tax=Notoacmeibacter sp. MSK16QG-6 TaxID=2957982 RepID=UPI0020A0CC14|nr:ABC transporter permease subunit [Notoacmeibacter sp. MSK16QG-6]MCP1200535.1 ABC transporter permease subunit [Notoacmeibacter sp. MSK16QG-6]
MTVLLGYLHEILQGLTTTLSLFLISLVIGFVAATIVAAFQIRFPGVLAGAVWSLMFCIRGVPLLLILYVVYYGFPLLPFIRETALWTVFASPYWCAIICLAFVEMAFTSEIIRGAYYQTPKEQVEAARSLGLSSFQTFRVAILPAMLRNGFPPYTTEVILLCKSTALAFTITVMDIMGYANEIRARTLDIYQPLLIAGAIYICTVVVTRLILSSLFNMIAVGGAETADQK